MYDFEGTQCVPKKEGGKKKLLGELHEEENFN